MRVMASLPDLGMHKEVQKTWAEQVGCLKATGIEDVVLTVVYVPISAENIKACEARGGNPMGMTAQNQNCKPAVPEIWNSL